MSRPNEALILGTAGHIDHGKTALVKALTGTDTDRLPDEKRRGITIDLGFAVLRQGETTISVIDVPGHERFIRNMLAGAGGFDMAMLIVAADDGVMPQTLEHLEILSLLGILKGIVAMTKCDLVPKDWQDLVEQEIRDRIAGTFLESSPIMRVSTHSSEGLEVLKRKIFELAADFERVERPSPFRLSVDRVFVKSGFGVVATGTVGAGIIRIGETVQIHPGMEKARVRSLQSHGHQVQSASNGQRLAVNLAGVKGDALARGVEIAEPGFLQESRWLAVRIKALERAPSMVKHRGVYRLHIGTAEVEAKLILFESSQLSNELPVVALFRTSEPIAAVHGRPFVLRSVSPAMTLAGGRVLWPTARLIRRRDKTTWRLVSELDAEDHAARLAAWMTLTGAGRPDDSTAICELGITSIEAAEAAEKLISEGRIVRLFKPGVGSASEITCESAGNLLARIRRRLESFHRDHPRLTAMAINQLTGRFADVPAEHILAILNSEMARSIVVVREGMVSLAGFKPQLTQAEQRLRKAMWEELRQGGLTPPLLDEFSKSTGTKSSVLLELLRILVSEGLAEEIGDGLFLSKAISTMVVEKVRDRFAGKESLTVSELKETLGVSRKYAVPIVEWLDRCGVTRREGDLRFLVVQESSTTNEKATPQ